MSKEGTITNRGRGGDTYRAAGFWQGWKSFGSESLVGARPNSSVVEVRGSINNADVLPHHIDNWESVPSIGYWNENVSAPDNSAATNYWIGSHYTAESLLHRMESGNYLYTAGTGTSYFSIPDSSALDLTHLASNQRSDQHHYPQWPL